MSSSSAKLTPFYRSQEPNENVLLYEGPLQFKRPSGVACGDGTVRFTWLPWPRICFEMSIRSPAADVIGEGVLESPDGHFRYEAFVNKVQTAAGIGDDKLSLLLHGRVTAQLYHGTGNSLASVVFHLANFHSYVVPLPDPAPPDYDVERITFEADGWKITLEAMSNPSEREKLLKHCSGYAFTHVGRMERDDASPFDVQQASNLLDALFAFLSFARGQWSPALLPVGLDGEGKQIWQRWDARQTSNWQYRPSWFSGKALPKCVTETFPGFMRLWNDPDWNKTLRVAIHWYIVSNAQVGAIEGTIVLQQLAFEVLAARLFEERCLFTTFTKKKFKNLCVSEKIKTLLTEATVPLAIPATLIHLSASAQAQTEIWTDGPTALTRLRNCITHPTGTNRQTLDRVSDLARAEACSLAVWYLELMLLRRMDYKGYYFNRITAKYCSDLELVPWA
jgi:hypothetical protein